VPRDGAWGGAWGGAGGGQKPEGREPRQAGGREEDLIRREAAERGAAGVEEVEGGEQLEEQQAPGKGEWAGRWGRAEGREATHNGGVQPQIYGGL
jgi:hypothetical protein